MGSSSSAARKPNSVTHKDQPVSTQRPRHGTENIESTAGAGKTQTMDLLLPANNEDDVKTAQDLQRDHPELFYVFEEMHSLIEKLEENQKSTWQWLDLQESIESSMEASYFKHYKKKRVLGRYMALLRAAGSFAEAYGDALEEAGLTAFTARTVESHQADAPLGFLVMLRSVLLNYTDSSLYFCEKLADTGIFKYFVEDLKESRTHLEDFDDVPDDCFVGSIGVLYNSARNPAIRQTIRKLDTVSVLLPFLKSKSEKVRLLVLLSLANMLDEDQNDLLLADDSVFDFILFILERAWKYQSHRFDGFSVEEVIDGMTGLAKNDSNKTLLVKKGVLPRLMNVLRDSSSDEEIEKAVKCVWELAFDEENRKDFNKNKELMDLLKQRKTSSDNAVAKASEGALWVLQMKTKDENKKSNKEQQVDISGHVMISYQWGDQKTLLQVKELLKADGYKLWMDVDNMGGSTLQAMAEAVQNASVVLVCMSERYKESQNCRSEAEYAFSLQKTIIPLLMQREYKPDGWLGMIKGTKLFFDFSGKYDFNKKLIELSRELGEKGKGLKADVVDGEVRTSAAVLKAAPVDAARGPATATWSNKDVHNWLVKSGFSRHSSLKDLSGEDLVFLKKLSYKAPEFFYTYVKGDLHLNDLRDIRRFSEAVERLN
ncbi:uncharacterized protein LOC124131331 isoform X2 [Haliotis rufescens]|nr:uncharacterized protein LOC124131331 isoform X2 [Haliotis rufescens]